MPTLQLTIQLRRPEDALVAVYRAAWATLGDQVQINDIRSRMAYAALGLCWRGPAPWRDLAQHGSDMRAWGREIMEALLALDADADAIGIAASQSFSLLMGALQVQPAPKRGPTDALEALIAQGEAQGKDMKVARETLRKLREAGAQDVGA